MPRAPERRGRAAAAPRLARADELEAVLALERACFQPYRQATRASLRRSLAGNAAWRQRRTGAAGRRQATPGAGGRMLQTVWVLDGPGGRLDALLVLWHHAHLVRVYDVATRPERQGEGLGHRLMAWADRIARDAGCRWVSLEADPKEPGLVDWYRRQGFAVVGRLPGYYRNGNAAVRMRKPVAGP